jgi:lipoprotein-anchoring transpeptidase ErfK/SrfK
MKVSTYSVRFYYVLMLMGLTLVLSGFSQSIRAESININTASKPTMVIASNTFIYNPKTLTWTAINDNGKVVRSGRGSGGRSYCPDIHRSCRTPTGTYHVVSKRGSDCRSSRYPVGRGGAPMPYCMFFSKYYAIHGSPDVPNRNASHGCIRVPPSDARWLSGHFVNVGTKVVVKPY